MEGRGEDTRQIYSRVILPRSLPPILQICGCPLTKTIWVPAESCKASGSYLPPGKPDELLPLSEPRGKNKILTLKKEKSKNCLSYDQEPTIKQAWMTFRGRFGPQSVGTTMALFTDGWSV